MWFNLPLHTLAWERGWMSRRSFLWFVSRLIENIQKKRSSEYLYYSSCYFLCWKLCPLDHDGIFHRILNMYQASIKEENVSARQYQQRRAIFSFDWKSKRFSVPENNEVIISSGENVFSSSEICKDATTRKPTQELLCMFCTLSIKDTTWSSSYSNSGHRNCCNNDRALLRIVIFTTLCKCLEFYEKALAAY